MNFINKISTTIYTLSILGSISPGFASSTAPENKDLGSRVGLTRIDEDYFGNTVGNSDQEDSDIDLIDRETDLPNFGVESVLAAELSILSFHTYLQATNGETPDITKETYRYKSSLLGSRYIAETHFAITDSKWREWEFKTFEGENGIFCIKQILRFLDGKTVAGMVGHNKKDKIIVVSYRGTQEGNEWPGQNFNVFSQDTKYIWDDYESKDKNDNEPFSGKVHAGYANMFKSTKKEVKESILIFLKSLSLEERTGYKILFTGHSLGGANASLAAAYFSTLPELADLSKSLIVFGAPRVGGKEFCDWLNTKGRFQTVKLYKLANDPVPNFSPETLGYVDIVSVPDILPAPGGLVCHDVREYLKQMGITTPFYSKSSDSPPFYPTNPNTN